MILSGAISHKLYIKKKEDLNHTIMIFPLVKHHIEHCCLLEVHRKGHPVLKKMYDFFPITAFQLFSLLQDKSTTLFSEIEKKNVISTYNLKKDVFHHQSEINISPLDTCIHLFCHVRMSKKPDQSKHVNGVVWCTREDLLPASNTDALLSLITSVTTKSQFNVSNKPNPHIEDDYWLTPEDMDISTFIIAYIKNKSISNKKKDIIFYEISKYNDGMIQGTATINSNRFHFARNLLCAFQP